MKNIKRVRPALCLVVLLQLTAVSSELPSIIIRDGEDITLPSGSSIGDQFTCDGVDWIVKRSTGEVNLVTRGQVNSKRLALTANCSLVLKTVTHQDVGIYHFQLIHSGQDTQFYLSVLRLSHQEDHEGVTLTCSVPAPNLYRHKVKWVYEAAGEPDTVITEEAQYSISVRFPSPSAKQRSAYLDPYKCEVTDGYKNTKHLFGFRPQSTDQEPGEDETTESTAVSTTKPMTATERGGPTKTSSVWTTLKDWWPLIVAAGVSVVVVVTVVLIVRWRRTAGRKTKSSDSAELRLNPTAPPQASPETSPDAVRPNPDPETDVSYAVVSYTKKKSGSEAQVSSQTQNRPDDCETVTYSMLKASSPPPPPDADPGPVYATVRKTTHRTESSS